MLVHIVPAVPPAFNGLSDYCYKLWEHWPQPRPDWTCLAVQIPDGAGAAWPQARIAPFELSKRGLLLELQRSHADCVVLHYVGYAYHRKGAPLWLPAALRAWKRRSNAPLCVMFHELWAQGSPRQSAFWLQPLTKGVVKQLANLADSWITSSELGAQTLVERAGAEAARGHIVPIGSAIEPVNSIDWARPWPLGTTENGTTENGTTENGTTENGKIRLAIFGLPSNRLSVLRVHRELIEILVADGSLESVAMIGKAGAPHELQREKEWREQIALAAMWRDYHDLAPADLSRVLQNQHAALTHYSPELLTKSSVYPAFCLHGLITICQKTPPLMKRSTDSQNLKFVAPHLASNASCALETQRKLQDQRYIAALREETQAAARHQLSWSSIVEVWKQAVAG